MSSRQWTVVVVMMCAMQQAGAQEVDEQAEHCNDDSFVKANGLRCQQARAGLKKHQGGHAQQHHGAGKAAEHFDLPGAEGKAQILSVMAGGGIGQGSQP